MKRLTLFFSGILILWSIKELIFTHYQEATLALIIVKLMVWVVPVYCYLKYLEKIQNPFAYLKLTQNVGKGIAWGLMISLFLIFIEGSLIVAFGGKVHFDIGVRWFTTFIFAFPEEVLFRGFILQKMSEWVKFRKANIYASLLFVSIHLPAWFFDKIMLPKLLFSMVTVFLVGIGLGYLFRKTNSLWSTTIVHTVYNLLLYIRV